MTARTGGSVDSRRIVVTIIPFIVVIAAGIAIRTPSAAAYPFAAAILFLWIVTDASMLALIARSEGTPGGAAMLGVSAGASLAVWLGSPPAIRNALMQMPLLMGAMAVVVLGHLGWAAARARRVLDRSAGNMMERWVAAASEIIPGALVRLAVAEWTVIHMAVFRWGGPADVPANARAFPYHTHLASMCATLLILSSIEMAAYHLLVGHWSRTATIVMFVLSDIGFVYLVGLIKSFRFRPILLTPEGVRVRAGLLVDQFIPLEAIVAIETDFTGDEVRDPATLNTALLAWPNVMLRLDRPMPRRSLVKRGAFTRIAFRLDDPAPFVRLLMWRLGQGAEGDGLAPAGRQAM